MAVASPPRLGGGQRTRTLAELMLPDGVHKRKDDWTVFFLNRDVRALPQRPQTSHSDQ